MQQPFSSPPSSPSKAFAPSAAPNSGVRDVLKQELAEERAKRREAEEGKRAAVDLAQTLSMQVDHLKNEVEALQNELRRLHIGSCETSEDARCLAQMFQRLSEEAESVAAQKEMEEMERMGNEDEIDTERMVSMAVARGEASPEKSDPAEALDPEKAKEEAEFQLLQTNFMAMQYDDMFESLEAREADLTLCLVRASWLRQHHRAHEAEGQPAEELIPKRGTPLPPEARVTAKELRRIFDAAPGCRGYRKVDLPFLTLAQFWKATEHPDPDEEVLQGVIQYLQARWEEFTERDVGIFIDLNHGAPAARADGDADAPPLGAGEADPVFWLVTSRARTRMAEAQHDAYMDYIERQKALVEGGEPSSSDGADAADGHASPTPARSKAADADARAPTPPPLRAADEAAPSSAAGMPAGWSSARSVSSASSQSKASSEEML